MQPTRSPPLRPVTPTIASSSTCGDLAEHALDVVRVDVLAGRRDDDVLHAADEDEPPAAIELAEVAGVEPAVLGLHLLRGLGVGVARHDVGAAREDLADAVLVGRVDLDRDARDRLADLAGGAARLGDGEHRRGLGEAVALGELEAEAREELLRVLRERGAAGDEVADVAAEPLVHLAEEDATEVDAGASCRACD